VTRALVLSLSATALLALVSLFIPGVWWRMAAMYAVMLPASLLFAKIDWRKLWRLKAWHLPAGLGAAVVLYAGGWVLHRLFETSFGPLMAWKTEVSTTLLIPLLVFIVVGEEIVWRNAVTMSVPGWRGVALGAIAFGVAHAPLGVPLLVGLAFGAGMAWSAMVAATKSAWPALVCHLAFDVAVLLLIPY